MCIRDSLPVVREVQQPLLGGIGHAGRRLGGNAQGIGEPNRIYVLIPGKEDAALA